MYLKREHFIILTYGPPCKPIYLARKGILNFLNIVSVDFLKLKRGFARRETGQTG